MLKLFVTLLLALFVIGCQPLETLPAEEPGATVPEKPKPAPKPGIDKRV